MQSAKADNTRKFRNPMKTHGTCLRVKRTRITDGTTVQLSERNDRLAQQGYINANGSITGNGGIVWM